MLDKDRLTPRFPVPTGSLFRVVGMYSVYSDRDSIRKFTLLVSSTQVVGSHHEYDVVATPVLLLSWVVDSVYQVGYFQVLLPDGNRAVGSCLLPIPSTVEQVEKWLCRMFVPA